MAFGKVCLLFYGAVGAWREGSGAAGEGFRGCPLGCVSCPGRGLSLHMPPAEHYLPEEPEPYLAAYLHAMPWPNEHNCSASRRISLEVLAGDDHRPYTFFIAPG